VIACGSSGSSDLTGKAWKWQAATTVAPASQSVVPNPANYTITFGADGKYAGKADCNQIAGEYTVSGKSLTIKPGVSTMAACGDASLDQVFILGLASVTTYKVDGATLTLSNAAGDTMTFGS
jgi:heat shock protein HslJ